MRTIFDHLAGGLRIKKVINLKGRKLSALDRSSDCIWFDFSTLCGTARSKEDYLALAARYATLFLSDVPPLNNYEQNEAVRRFTWLIDILYDNHVRLVIGAQVPLAKLYGEQEGGESGRTLSRLYEMQSQSPLTIDLAPHSAG